ncbi:MAG: tetratricopeptide repeat protein [Myxococcales bacterium]|nr:tetratricopeptide repeat protein [Myxococcales bacterium]
MHTVPGLFDRLTRLYGEGERALAEGRFQDAIGIFSEGLGLDDQFRLRYVTMYAQRAFAKQRMGDHQGAIPDYTKAIQMEPPINQAQYHFHRGMCFADLEDYQQAVSEYAKSIELFPDHPGPYHLRGKLFATKLERYQEAIADFDRMLQMHGHPEALQLRGFAKLNLGRGAEAIPDLFESNRLEPDTYTDYLLAWAGAIAPNDELFYHSMEAVLRADPGYKQYFLDNDDYARFAGQPRFKQIVGAF